MDLQQSNNNWSFAFPMRGLISMKSFEVWDEEYILQTSLTASNITGALPFPFRGLIEMKACKIWDDDDNLKFANNLNFLLSNSFSSFLSYPMLSLNPDWIKTIRTDLTVYNLHFISAFGFLQRRRKLMANLLQILVTLLKFNPVMPQIRQLNRFRAWTFVKRTDLAKFHSSFFSSKKDFKASSLILKNLH